MPVIKRALKDGELSLCQQVYERIRIINGYSEEHFYESYERKPRPLWAWMNRVINRDSSDLQCTF